MGSLRRGLSAVDDSGSCVRKRNGGPASSAVGNQNSINCREADDFDTIRKGLKPGRGAVKKCDRLELTWGTGIRMQVLGRSRVKTDKNFESPWRKSLVAQGVKCAATGPTL